ncbi:MAG TPA: T9SS type A sorting domain-containing protein, partial [Haliscomenobacter sp.]|nr:T9SS type A sorting domain-containing protein [Haliscomenobacter sp.]
QPEASSRIPYAVDVVPGSSLNQFFISYYSQGLPTYRVDVQTVYRQGLDWGAGPVTTLDGTSLDAIPNSQLMLDLNTNAFACLANNGVYGALYHINKTNHAVTEFRYRYAKALTHIDYYQHDHILVGAYDNQENVVLVKIDRNTLNEVWIDTLNIKGKSIKWIQGEQDSIIYIACSYVNKFLSIIKYNVEARRIVWSKTLREEEKDQLFFTDLSFNRQDQYAMITGYVQNGDAQDQVLLIAIDADGSILANMNQPGEFPGYNRGLVLNSPASSPYTLIGGSLNKKPREASAAFVSTFTGKDVQNSIKGLIFWDENKDGIQNPGEKTLSLGQIIFNFTNRVYINNDGYFKALVSAGRYSVRYMVPKNWTLTTGEFTYRVDASQTQNLKDTLRFGIAPTQLIDQVEIFVTSQPLVCNEQGGVYVQIRNSGTTYQNIKLRLDHQSQPLLQNVAPDSLRPGKLYWSFDSIPAGAVKWLVLSFEIPGIGEIGDSLSFNTIAYWGNPLKMDSTRFNYGDVLLCSYDPNDKLVRSTKIAKNRFTLFDQYLYYTIRFQNTGNYPARNITIIDTLDRDLDFATFDFLGASHPITEVIGKNNAVQFVFKGINLPDSVNNEMASHGFVSFRIKDRAGLPEKTEITNTAYIYFDQNPPIVTNTTLSILVSRLDELSTSTQNPQRGSNFRVYPNPAQGYVIVTGESTNSQTRWSMINAQGQTCMQGLTKTWPFEINTQHLSNGLYYLQLVGQEALKVLIIH